METGILADRSMNILFVCAGNTCRSPLAVAAWQAFAGPLLAAAPEDSPVRHMLITVGSAGLAAAEGAAASPHTVTVAESWGVPLDTHCSRMLTLEVAQQADLIATMTPEQVEIVHARFPQLGAQTVLLGSFATLDDQPEVRALLGPLADEPWMATEAAENNWILDPFGGSLEAYQACGTHIRWAIEGLAQAIADGRVAVPSDR